jgi:hypothetical protein
MMIKDVSLCKIKAMDVFCQNKYSIAGSVCQGRLPILTAPDGVLFFKLANNLNFGGAVDEPEKKRNKRRGDCAHDSSRFD